jgi:DNA-binding XRE family transcriptional regulator
MSKIQNSETHSKRIEEISLFLKNWRINEGLTQLEFSKSAEVHTNTIQNIESCRNMSLITLLKCIDAMDGMTLSEFFSEIE